jgi:hypothetical protein
MDKKTKAARYFRLSQFFWVITQRVVVISVPKRRKEITSRCVISQKIAVLIFSKPKFLAEVDIIPESQHASESKSYCLRADVKLIPARIDALCDTLIHDRFIEIYPYSMEQSPS